MAVSSKTTTEACILAVLLGLCIAARTALAQGRIMDHLVVNGGNTSVSPDGQILSLYLTNTSSSGFESKDTYLFTRADVRMKLVPGNSAGTVTTFYFLSVGPWDIHDEIDLEFLGNSTGEPYTLHTNIFANGVGQKEQQFRLNWFDPTADFHTYSIVWTAKNIIVLVDGTPIREFRNHADENVAYPSTQKMKIFGSLWNADDWATQGGRVKTDWNQPPFVAQYRDFAATTSSGKEMNGKARKDMNEKRAKYMIYNYCDDKKRFVNGTAPPQCNMSGTG